MLIKTVRIGDGYEGQGNESVKDPTEITCFYLCLVYMELETRGINANFLPDIRD